MRVALLFASFCAALMAQVAPAPRAAPAAAKPATGTTQAKPAATGTATPAKPTPIDLNAVVLRAGDFTMTAAQFAEIVKGLEPSLQQSVLTTGRRAFAEKIVELHFLAVEAQKRGLDKDPNLKLQMDFQTNKLLAQAMFQELQKTTPVTDAGVQAYYDAHKTEFEAIIVRHVLVRVKGSPLAARSGTPELTDDEAKAKAEAIRKRLMAGEDFAKVAKADSDDVTSGVKGGDLGEVSKGKMVASFERAAFALKPGDISEPVRSPYGYHVIQVLAHRTKTVAEVKDAIVTQLRPEVARKASKAIVDREKAELNDSFFASPAAR